MSELVDETTNGKFIVLRDTWTYVSQTLEFKPQTDQRNIKIGVTLYLVWEGDGTIYLDDFSLKKSRLNPIKG